MIPAEVRGDIFKNLETLSQLLEEAPPHPIIQEYRAELTRLTAELRAADVPVPAEATPEYVEGLLAETNAQIASIEAEEKKLQEQTSEPEDDFIPWDGDEIGRVLGMEIGLQTAPATVLPPPPPVDRGVSSKPSGVRPPVPAMPIKPAKVIKPMRGGEFDSLHDG